MTLLGTLIATVFICLVAYLLFKRIYPHAVLLFSGLIMLFIARALNFQVPPLNSPTGVGFFDNFEYITESFIETNAGVGLLIMAISGFVTFIEKIGASDALVHVALKPLSALKKYPYILASLIIPIGQLLFVCIPSAAGLGLLLMASVFPMLVKMGVSRLSAVSVITACTAFGVGPASVITARSAQIIEKGSVAHFFDSQLPLVWPLTLTLMVAYFFVNRYFDKKEKLKKEVVAEEKKIELKVPLYYAVIPLLPLFILFFFSDAFSFLPVSITLNTTLVMIFCVFVALVFELIRTRNIKVVFDSLKEFFNGMGDVFKDVVTLIVAADIFSKGLIALMFIDGLSAASQHLGFGAAGTSIVMMVMIFLASILMGSGNAAFFAFGPLVPKISTSLGVSTTYMILPMEFAASMGRTVSPISGVLIATSAVAKVSPFDVAKRNAIPFAAAIIVMLIYHFVIQN
jgi:C4-dicarboxylate transporter, DcuC family